MSEPAKSQPVEIGHGLRDGFKGSWVESIAHYASANKVFIIVGWVAFCMCATIFLWIKDRARRGTAPTTAGLNYVVGPMGSGKSMFGVRTIVGALTAGKYVITNCRLLPGWAEKVCEWYHPRDNRDPARRAARIAFLEAHYIYERSLRTAMRYRVPCARCGGDTRECGHVGPFQEARAVFVWDETHNDLNNRDYQGHGDSREAREAEKERRRIVIRWATQLRKLGFSGYLLSQHHENTDAQLRRVCNHLIRLQNQRNVVGIAKLLPQKWTLFLCYWYPAHLADNKGEHLIQPVRMDRYWLPKERHLYDSWETFHGIDELDGEDRPILLPAIALELKAGSTPGGVGAPPLGGESPPDHPAPPTSTTPVEQLSEAA